MKTERKRAVAGLVEPGAELLEVDGALPWKEVGLNKENENENE